MLDPFSVCFSQIYPTQVNSSSDVSAASALLLFQQSMQQQSDSQSTGVGASYAGAGVNVNHASTHESATEVANLNQNSFSSRDIRNYAMKSLSQAAIGSMNHCMDLKAQGQPGTVSIWQQVTSDPRRILIHVMFASLPELLTANAKIALAKADGQQCERCDPLMLSGNATKDFILHRDNPEAPMLAEISVGGNDHSVDIDGFRDLKFIQLNQAAPCLKGAAHIVKVSGPRYQDGESRYSTSGFADGDFPSVRFSGLGWLVEPSQHEFSHDSAETEIANFAMHDHKYIAASVPDPDNATVYYEFSAPIEITQLEVIQHQNGIAALHGWLIDDSKQGYSSGDLGIAERLWAPVTAGPGKIPEGQTDVFTFPDVSPRPKGRYLKVTITNTPYAGGWATYRMFPRDRYGVRILPQSTCSNGTQPY